MEEFTERDLPNLFNVLQRFSTAVIERYKLKMTTHNASGNLLNNLNSTVEVSGVTVKVNLQIADYFRYLENGRGPTSSSSNASGKTLKESILDWIRVKGIIPRADANGKLPSEASLAYLIARKIHNEGYNTAPQHCLKEAVNEVYSEYQQQFEVALNQDFNENYAIKILNKIKSIKV